MNNRIKALSKLYFEEVQQIRHHLHRFPELSYNEVETSSFIASKLEAWGIEYQRNVGGYNVVALLKGDLPDGAGRTIALRADHDALPIVEQGDKPYISQNKGVMHACGHDVHTASLLGCLRILKELKSAWGGTVKAIFQHAEEVFPGGASQMIEAGVLKNPDVEVIFGQHVFPDLEPGKVGFREGIYMASADEIDLIIRGKGGHGATPHACIDTILVASHVLVALQQVASRRANPIIPTVLSFGTIQGGLANNVIPEEVVIKGTFRTLDEAWRKEAHQLIREIAEGVAKSMGATAEVVIRVGYPCLINDSQPTLLAQKTARAYLGEANVVELPIRMTSEDFSYYSQVAKSCFYRLGTGNKNNPATCHSVHTPLFDIDESALETGMGLLAAIAIKSLENEG